MDPIVHPREKRRIRILLAGPLPPPPGGISYAVRILLESNLAEAVDLHHVATNTNRPVSEKGRLDLRNLREFAAQLIRFTRALHRSRADVVQVETSGRISFVKNAMFILVARAMGRATVLSIHSSAQGMPLDEFRSHLLGRSFGRFVLRSCDRVRLLSERWTLAFAAAWGIDASRVVGVANAIAKVESPERPAVDDPPEILFLGWMGRRKGVFDLLEACADLKRRDVAFRLRIVGPEDEPGIQDRVVAEVQRLGLSGDTRIEGAVSREQALPMYGEAAVYALPSYAEGLPLGLLEAMSAGRPVVATTVGAIPELVDDGVSGRLVAPGNVPALADALASLLIDRDLRHRIGQVNRKVVSQRNGISNQVDAFKRLYTSIVDERETPRNR
jgi:glycosyltransferase involved in cell wall biosynthesis